MSVTRVELVATMDSGKTLTVVADQRDFAKWEIQPEAMRDTYITRMRFLAWSAAYRQQLYKGSFAEFNEADCVEVFPPETDDEDGDGLDPGQSAASAEH